MGEIWELFGKSEFGELFAKRQRSEILSPEGGTFSSPGRQPWEYIKKKHQNPERCERVTVHERPYSLILTVDFISISPYESVTHSRCSGFRSLFFLIPKAYALGY